MHAAKKTALLWSGGKDSALALHFAAQNCPGYTVEKLVTCVSQAYDRVSMHGVRRQLIEDQANAIGLPVDFIAMPTHDSPTCPMAHTLPDAAFPPNDSYTTTMIDALKRLRNEGFEAVAFGDIFLEELRRFRDRILDYVGLEGCYPLWGKDTAKLYDEFNDLGFRAVTVCVDTKRLSVDFCGQLLTTAFRESLPAGADPCGELGEYHSFAFDGPTFRHPVGFKIGEVHLHEPFAFQELYPDVKVHHELESSLACQHELEVIS